MYSLIWTNDHDIQLEISPGQPTHGQACSNDNIKILRQGIELFITTQQQKQNFDQYISIRKQFIQIIDHQYSERRRLQPHTMGDGQITTHP